MKTRYFVPDENGNYYLYNPGKSWVTMRGTRFFSLSDFVVLRHTEKGFTHKISSGIVWTNSKSEANLKEVTKEELPFYV